MNWIRFGLILGVIGLTIVLTTACGASEAVPAAPTAIPTPVVQVAPSLTPIAPAPIATPTRVVTPTLGATRAVTPTLGTTRTVTLTPTPSPKDMVMAAFAKALTSLKTYRVEVPEEGRYIAVQLPDRMYQEGLDGFLKIGGTAWRRDVTGKVISGPTGSVPFLDRANLIWLRDQFAKSSQATLLGPGMAEGVPCIGYSINVTMTKQLPPKTPGGPPEVSQLSQVVKIWFANADGYPRRVDMGPPTSITENFFNFNEPFDVNPP
jgi:hypothetical protein